jgi:phage terminase large subunit GpA-like protein
MGLFDFLKREKKEKYIYTNGTLLTFYVECEKCGELFKVVIRQHSELFRTYGKTAGEYEIQKELIGAKCQNKINVHFDLKVNLSEIGHEIQGGRLLTKKEFEEKIQSGNF